MSKTVIKNIGLMLTGQIESPIADADCIVAVGNYTPRQQQLRWIDSTLNGDVTTLISAGEVHMPGRPKDIVGLKAMAIAAQRWYENFRSSGIKVHAGAPVIEHGMVEQDFKDLADAGVTLFGEVGLGTVKDGKTAQEMIGWARKYGIQSTIHTGGPSIPGSGLIDADMVLETGTDVVGHINGSHSALPDDQIVCLCENCTAALEIVHNGNERAALLTLNTARELGKLDQVILGNDGPAGSGGPTPWHPAYGCHALLSWRCRRRNRLLLCQRQHRTAPRPRHRASRNRQSCRFRSDGSGATRPW